MIYQTVFLNIFLKQFKKLPQDPQERVKQRVLQLLDNPYLGLRLRGAEAVGIAEAIGLRGPET